MKKIAILQSNYIPWKGYFDLIAYVDEFILYDEVQYTRRDWRNRNQVKTSQGIQWMTVPVLAKGKYHQKIIDTEIDGFQWKKNHWKLLELNYRNAKYFNEISEWLKPLYFSEHHVNLSNLNLCFIRAICNYLKVNTPITYSSDYQLNATDKTERLVNLCDLAGADEYISGPSAKSYINEDCFKQKDIKLTWFEYVGYPEYPQLWGEFVHGVTILDLLFNCGQDSHLYMRRARS